MILDRIRCLSVPINEKGIQEYDLGVENTPNIKEFFLEDDEFKKLYYGTIFDEINVECNLLIDEYESEIIHPEHFERCMSIISNKDVPVFREALELAIKHKTLLGLDF